eukprot:3386062-Ditylum_brightwellii.AAC.1
MMSAVITVMRKIIRGRLALTRKSFGIKCLLRMISLNIITGPRVASSQSRIALFARLGIMTIKEDTLARIMLRNRNKNKNKNKTTPTVAVTIQEDEDEDQTSAEEEDDDITAGFSAIFNN